VPSIAKGAFIKQVEREIYLPSTTTQCLQCFNAVG